MKLGRDAFGSSNAHEGGEGDEKEDLSWVPRRLHRKPFTTLLEDSDEEMDEKKVGTPPAYFVYILLVLITCTQSPGHMHFVISISCLI